MDTIFIICGIICAIILHKFYHKIFHVTYFGWKAIFSEWITCIFLGFFLAYIILSMFAS